MPPRKGMRRKRRRNYKKKYNPTGTLNVIPKQLVKKFRYVTDVSIDPDGAGAMASYIIRANSLYDPDYQLGGHQVYGFDQYCPTLYNHVTVLGSKLTAVFSLGNPSTATAQNNIICGISLRDDAAAITNSSLVREQGGYSTWTMITNSTTPKRRSMKYSAKRFHNVTDVKDNDQLSHTSQDNPAEEAFYHIWAAPCATNVDAFNTTVQIIVEYIAVLQEPNTFGQS